MDRNHTEYQLETGLLTTDWVPRDELLETVDRLIGANSAAKHAGTMALVIRHRETND